MIRPPGTASLSLDLDDQWAYLKTRGHPSWTSLPSYFATLVPTVRSFLRERGLTLTVFVVGQDAALPRNRDALGALAADGHEIGNHAFHHEADLHTRPRLEIDREIASAQEAIERATGQRPRGFRGPGFSLSHRTLEVLADRGYAYDASSLPTFVGPLARAYYRFALGRPGAAEGRLTRALFGPVGAGRRPAGPHRWRLRNGSLLEIPVTTLPGLTLPMHMSYLHALGVHSEALALGYLRAGLALCRRTGTEPSFLLHPTDFLGAQDAPALAFFPGMGLPSARKLSLLGRALDLLASSHELVTVGAHARRASDRAQLPEIPADASHGAGAAP